MQNLSCYLGILQDLPFMSVCPLLHENSLVGNYISFTLQVFLRTVYPWETVCFCSTDSPFPLTLHSLLQLYYGLAMLPPPTGLNWGRISLVPLCIARWGLTAPTPSPRLVPAARSDLQMDLELLIWPTREKRLSPTVKLL